MCRIVAQPFYPRCSLKTPLDFPFNFTLSRWRREQPFTISRGFQRFSSRLTTSSHFRPGSSSKSKTSSLCHVVSPRARALSRQKLSLVQFLPSCFVLLATRQRHLRVFNNFRITLLLEDSFQR